MEGFGGRRVGFGTVGIVPAAGDAFLAFTGRASTRFLLLGLPIDDPCTFLTAVFPTGLCRLGVNGFSGGEIFFVRSTGPFLSAR